MDHLTALPVEMIVKIADSLPNTNDLLNFRLTSRLVSESAAGTFARAYSANCHFLDTSYSLKLLIEVAQNPAYRKFLRCINIYATGPICHICDDHVPQQASSIFQTIRGHRLAVLNPSLDQLSKDFQDTHANHLTRVLRALFEAGITVSIKTDIYAPHTGLSCTVTLT